MSAGLEARAELLKLARALGAQPEDVAFLEGAAPGELRLLRDEVADKLFALDRAHFEGAAALAGRIPRGLSAQLAQHALGARLAARTAGLVAPDIARDLARRLPTDFLADIAVHADPRRLAPLLANLPAAQVAEVTRVLAGREEWLTMGAFVGHLHDDALVAAVAVLDGEALLRTGFVMDHKDRVAAVLDQLDDVRVRELLDAAALHGLWQEALELSLQASPAQRERLAAALDALDDERLQGLADAVARDPALAEAAASLAQLAPVRLKALL